MNKQDKRDLSIYAFAVVTEAVGEAVHFFVERWSRQAESEAREAAVFVDTMKRQLAYLDRVRDYMRGFQTENDPDGAKILYPPKDSAVAEKSN